MPSLDQDFKPVLCCCICMLPLSVSLRWEQAEHSPDEDHDAGFEDNSDYDEMRYDQNVGQTTDLFAAGPLNTSSHFIDLQLQFVDPAEKYGFPSIKATECGHIYHSRCLCLWLDQLTLQGRSHICAYCRKPVRRKDVITIYPICCNPVGEYKETTNERGQDVDSAHVEEQEDCKNPLQYFDLEFCGTTFIVFASLATFLYYVHHITAKIEEESIDEDDFQVFGLNWTATVVLCITLSLLSKTVYTFIFQSGHFRSSASGASMQS